MNLLKNEVELFYKLQSGLLTYINNKLKLKGTPDKIQDINMLKIKDKADIRNALYENINLIEDFNNENPFSFNEDELGIISNWINCIRGKFIIVRYLKNYTAFLSYEDTKVYGVLGLADNLEEMFGSYPIMVETVLLPFQGKIIYDGIMNAYNISFGSGFRRSINDEYNESKAKYGIITSLPYREEKEGNDIENKTKLLKYYLKSESNRETYWDEIWEIIDDNEELLTLYHQELGKSHARSYGRRLKEIGIKDAWFGILEGVIVASGRTKDDVIDNVNKLVPSNKTNYVYYYKCGK